MPSATKRLILCCDGSWTPSKPSSSSPAAAHRPSNVARLSRMLARHGDDVPQIVFYSPSAAGTTVEQEVASAYLFLASNFAPDDEIAVFGTGRGATVARLVVGLVTEVGVLRAGEVGRWRDLWELWMTRRERGEGKQGALFWKDVLAHRSRGELAAIEELKGKVWTEVRVRIVGVWDTAAELGECKLHDTTLNSRIDYAFQALAMDETRAAFPPALWRLDSEDVSPEERTPVLKQCWFPGFHETVGGCDGDAADSKDGTDIADITLAWMCDQLDGLLTFDETAVAEFLNADQSAQKYGTGSSTETRRDVRKRSARVANQPAKSLLIAVLTHIVTILTAITALLSHTTVEEEEDDDPQPFAVRTPGQYHKNLEFEARTRPNDFATNESIHPSVKHRKDMFTLANVPYNPAPLQEWPVGDSPTKPRHHPWSREQLLNAAAIPKANDGGDGANAINAAAGQLRRRGHARKPHPEWTYRESAHGNGAKWMRPSVPRSSVFYSSPSATAASTTTTGSLRSYALSLSWMFFFLGPLTLVFRLLLSAVFGRRAVGGGERGQQQQQQQQGRLDWNHERQIELFEWVIREVPGRHNFEAKLLPWLVREQLRWRNRNRLDWTGVQEEDWARTLQGPGVGAAAAAAAVVLGQIEWNVDSGSAAAAAAAASAANEMEVVRAKRSRETEGSVTGAAVKRRAAGPLHVRKGSSAGVAETERAQSPRNGMRGRTSPEGSASAVASGRRGSSTPTGDGLRTLAQQPVRRATATARRETKEFAPGHRKSNSQSSLGWR